MAQLIHTPSDLTADAVEDLNCDINELRCLTESALGRLRSARAEVEGARQEFRRRTLVTELAQIRSAEDVLSCYKHDLGDFLNEARRAHLADIERLRQIKNEYADLLRLQQGIVAALSVGSDWQSPVFESSGWPTAGRHTGSVTEHFNDYKRDRHPQARAFEKSFLHEYVDTPPGFESQALMTACGMAAFTTILHYLCDVLGPHDEVVAARGMYHECRRLLADSRLRNRVHWVDEADIAGIIDSLRRLQPAALLFDSMCNSCGLAVPDTHAIMLELAARARRDVLVVVDNTCASIFCQLFPYAGLNPHVRPIVFESLTKYAQFGLDRAAAGMIVAPKREAKALDCLREHLGTNIADVCVSVIPDPNRNLLGRRLRRIERNSLLLAEHVMCCVENRTTPVIGSVHPGLDTHGSHDSASRLGFVGGFLSLEFRPEWTCAEGHLRFVSTLIHEARRRKLNLAAGASFGFNTTRVYRTATETDFGPFVRVSAGTEDRLEIERVKDVFTSAIGALGL